VIFTATYFASERRAHPYRQFLARRRSGSKYKSNVSIQYLVRSAPKSVLDDFVPLVRSPSRNRPRLVSLLFVHFRRGRPARDCRGRGHLCPQAQAAASIYAPRSKSPRPKPQQSPPLGTINHLCRHNAKAWRSEMNLGLSICMRLVYAIASSAAESYRASPLLGGHFRHS